VTETMKIFTALCGFKYVFVVNRQIKFSGDKSKNKALQKFNLSLTIHPLLYWSTR